MTNKFPDNREKYLGMGESAAGLGMMLGPVMGGVLYSSAGYFGAFMSFAVLLAAAGVLSLLVLPNTLNVKLDIMSDEERAESVILASKVPYSWFFSNRRSIFGLLTCTYVCLIFSFSEPFFTPALKEEKGIDEFYHGFIVCVQPLTYVAFTFLVGYVINKLPKRVFIVLSFAGCVIALFITGPSYIFGFPNYLWILLVGQAL